MRNCGLIYFIDADIGEHIEDFAKEVIRFKNKINRDIVAKFNDKYVYVKSNMTIDDFLFVYNKIKGEDKKWIKHLELEVLQLMN